MSSLSFSHHFPVPISKCEARMPPSNGFGLIIPFRMSLHEHSRILPNPQVYISLRVCTGTPQKQTLPSTEMPALQEWAFIFLNYILVFVLHEALCILSALLWVDQTFQAPQQVVLYTDNSNSAGIFNTLAASPHLNPILISACNISLRSFHDFKVLFILRYQNIIADTLSPFDINKAHQVD